MKVKILLLFILVFCLWRMLSVQECIAVDYTLTYDTEPSYNTKFILEDNEIRISNLTISTDNSIERLKENILIPYGFSMDGVYYDLKKDYYAMSIVIRVPFNSIKVERRYNLATLRGPKGDLELQYIAFPYGGLADIEKRGSITHSANVLSHFPYIVCTEPGGLSKEAMQVAESIKSRVKLFGYVHTGAKPPRDIKIIKEEIDRISNYDWYGVFLDCFGYDYGETRIRQNEIIDYAHKKGLKCFVNAWFIDDALGNKVDEIHNPKGEKTHLRQGDWYLLESFLMSNSGYRENMKDTLRKIEKGAYYKEKLGINIACLSYKRDSVSWDKAEGDIQISYFTALFYGFDGWWFTDRLENPNFNYARKLDLDVGDVLKKHMKNYFDDLYMAETDDYFIVLDKKKYPYLRFSFYNKVDR